MSTHRRPRPRTPRAVRPPTADRMPAALPGRPPGRAAHREPRPRRLRPRPSARTAAHRRPRLAAGRRRPRHHLGCLPGRSTRPSSPAATSSTSPCRCAAVGTIAIGIVLVLLLGEIDLSVGSVSGLAAAILAVLFVNQGWPLGRLAILAASRSGAVVGLLYGALFNRFGVPELRHHPGRPARLPRPAAARARQPGHDQPARSSRPGRASRPSSSCRCGWPTSWRSSPPAVYALSAWRRNARRAEAGLSTTP